MSARATVRLLIAAALLVTPLVEQAASARSDRVDGHYRIVSTDCYFAAGRCSMTFDIEQKLHRLSSPSDRYFRGHVNGVQVQFGEVWPPGVSEDGWWCIGTTNDGGRTVKGTMTDGIGGTGTFTLRYVRP